MLEQLYSMPPAPSPRTPKNRRNILSLEQRVDVLKLLDQGTSCRSLAIMLGCGKSQIAAIKREREMILQEWASGSRSDMKYIRKRKPQYAQLNDLVWNWFCAAMRDNFTVSGRMIQEKAKLLAAALGHEGFTASNGWLECWQRRYNIRLATLNKSSRQSLGPDPLPTVSSPSTMTLPDLISGFSPLNVFCTGEMGLFYRALPQHCQVIREDPMKGAKSSRERMTVLLTCSAAGEKLIPLVVGRSSQPKSFQDINELPVMYRSNRRAWMTSGIFTDWLDKLNNKMATDDRKILLIVGISGVHPDIERSHIKLMFVPTSSSSSHQACNTGIIQAVKVNYRKLFISHVLSQMSCGRSSADIVSKVSICDAVSWLKMAWQQLHEMTIANFFRRCGFHVDSSESQEGEDDLDFVSEPDLGPEQAKLMGGVTWSHFVNCDQDTATTFTVGSEWDDQSEDSQEEEEEEEDTLENLPKIKQERRGSEDQQEEHCESTKNWNHDGEEDEKKEADIKSEEEDNDESMDCTEGWEREMAERVREERNKENEASKDKEDTRSSTPVISTKDALDYMKDLIDLAFHLGDAGMVSAAARYQSLLIEHHLKQSNNPSSQRILEGLGGGTHS